MSLPAQRCGHGVAVALLLQGCGELKNKCGLPISRPVIRGGADRLRLIFLVKEIKNDDDC